MRRSKVLWRLLAVLLAFGLVAAACGDDDDTSDTTETTEAGDTTETTEEGAETTEGAAGEVTTGQGVSGDTISLGVLTPQTGPAAVIGNPLTAGNQTYFDALNAEGGVAGQYQVELVIADTQYQAPVAVQQYNAIKGDVAAFVQVLGTAITQAVLPQLEADGLIGSPASLDAFWQDEANLLPIGTTYQVQTINALSWYYEQAGNEAKTLCALSQDDPYGEAGVQGVEAFAEDAGIEVAAEATFRQGDQDFTAQLQTLQNANCEVVFLTALPTETGGIAGAAAGAGYAPQWIGQSPTWVTALSQSPLADYLTANFLLASQGPPWGDESIPGMEKMLADIAEFNPDQVPDIYFAFGYAQAWAMHQLLEKAVEMGDITPEGILAAASEEFELTFEELIGDSTYGPPDVRDPARTGTVFAVDPAAPAGLVPAAPDSVNYESELGATFTASE